MNQVKGGLRYRPPGDERGLMKKILAASAVTLASGAGIVAIAVGQAQGAPESGTLSYVVETKFSAKPSPTSNPGVNPALPRDPDRMNAGDMWGLHGRIFVNGKEAGRSHAVLTWTYLGRGRRQRGGAHIIKVVEDFGKGNTLVLEGVQVQGPTENPLAVVGGTGKYAGADGTAMIQEISFNGVKRIMREKVTVTFTP